MRKLQLFSMFALLLGCLCLQTGCTGYQLGSQLPGDIQTVYVPTVRNDTDEPLLEGEVTKAILDRIQRDGSLKISNEENADAILSVTLNHYKIEPLTYTSENRARPDEYRLVVGAAIEMIRQDNQKILVRNGSIQGQDDFVLLGDLTNSKTDALPGAADDLARYIVAAVTEAWPEI